MAVYPELGRRKAALPSLVIFSSWRADPAWQQKAERQRAKQRVTFSKLAIFDEWGRENAHKPMPEVLGPRAQ